MEYIYKTKGVCSSQIRFNIDGNVITCVSFSGGCNGNLKAVSKLVDGMTVEEIEKKLAGNTCGFRSTSCADQLTKAIEAAKYVVKVGSEFESAIIGESSLAEYSNASIVTFDDCNVFPLSKCKWIIPYTIRI